MIPLGTLRYPENKINETKSSEVFIAVLYIISNNILAHKCKILRNQFIKFLYQNLDTSTFREC